MIHGIEDGTELERMHDRYKKFSMNVYEHHKSGDHEKLKEAQKNLKVASKELNALMKRLHP